jgi:hypothetical protein
MFILFSYFLVRDYLFWNNIVDILNDTALFVYSFSRSTFTVFLINPYYVLFANHISFLLS